MAWSRWRAPPEQVQSEELTNLKRSHARLSLGLKFHEDHLDLRNGNGRRWGSQPVGEAARKRPRDDDDDDDDDAA